MVKYYGEVQGRRRGDYRSAELGAWFSTAEFLEKWGPEPTYVMDPCPARDISAYLSRAGEYVDAECDNSPECLSGLQVFHYGGATVTMKYRFYSDFSSHASAGNVSIRFASNDPLDDVVARVRERFPYLKEDASVDDCMTP